MLRPQRGDKISPPLSRLLLTCATQTVSETLSTVSQPVLTTVHVPNTYVPASQETWLMSCQDSR